MDIDYCELNQIVAMISAAVPAVLSLLKQNNKSSGTWYEVSDLATELFSMAIRKKDQKWSAFRWMVRHLFVALPQGYVNSPTLCYI